MHLFTPAQRHKLLLDKLYQERHSSAMQNSHSGKNITDHVSGALLAGGKSRRMQTDKATLTFNGESFFSRGIRALQTVCSDIHIAGDRSDLVSDGIESYADTFPGSSLGGLHNALLHARHDWVCVLPCDLPFPSPRLLRHLLQNRTEADAIIPRTEHGSEPLVACYNRRILPIIEQQIDAGEMRLTSLLDRLSVHYLDPGELPAGWRRALRNLNSPQDLDRLNAHPPVLTFVAHSGTGKTTLLEKLILELTHRGWTIGSLKHDAHKFDIDHPGKDSWRFTEAGSRLTSISSDQKTALIRQHDLPPTLEQLLLPFQGEVDIILTEGFKQSQLPKIEVFRKELDRPLICRGERHDPTLLAVAGDVKIDLDVPTFSINDPLPLADYIEKRFLP